MTPVGFTRNDPTTEAPFDGLTIEVFSTSAFDKSNKNNFSSIVVLKLGNAKAIVCGDNKKESFEILMKRTDFKEAVKDAWVLVAPHHGRESGYYEEFVDLVKPDITIISDKSGTDTSASQKYTNKSKGYKVNNKLTGEKEDRYCLTTRKDGNIEVIFEETDSFGYIGTLQINTHI
jgi:competence protein ComEC